MEQIISGDEASHIEHHFSILIHMLIDYTVWCKIIAICYFIIHDMNKERK